VLLCPTDQTRTRPAQDFSLPTTGLTPNNFAYNPNNPPAQGQTNNGNNCLSYFYGVDSDETKPGMLLTGDRNLNDNQPAAGSTYYIGLAARPGSTSTKPGGFGTNYAANTGPAWNTSMHNNGGNVALADGSAQQMTRGKFLEQLKVTDDVDNRVLFPQAAADGIVP
ncbi:MAG: hypothetical protein M3Y82_04600, partial [Verrucomicrobiota bacterium]|nr:hypothetical protein [Verrucomicrobiota bacterium]